MRKVGVFFTIVAVALTIALAVSALGGGSLSAQMRAQQAGTPVPMLINYQGYLTDASGNPLTGSYSIVFSIYSAPTGGTPLWSETQAVTVTEGLFNVLLGSQTPLTGSVFTGSTYLGVKVGTDPEMVPRQQIVSVPYAFKAQDAHSLGGVSSSDFATKAELSTSGAINTASNPVDWTMLKNVPAGFADGIDDTGSVAHGDTSLWYHPWSNIESSDVTISRFGFLSGHAVRMTASSSGGKWVYIQLPGVPSQLDGTEVGVKELQICYRTSSSATYISQTNLGTNRIPGSFASFMMSADHHSSTAGECYSVTSDPKYVINGGLVIEVYIYFASTSDYVELGSIGLRVGP